MQQQRDSLKARGICVIIPTYNNAGTVTGVVTRAMEQCDDVIVVCDGCTDNTVELLRALHPCPTILEMKRNGGKGSALKAGFLYAREAGFSYAITLDADGQHYPEDIPVMLEANRLHPDALIIGERQNLDSMERSAGSRFANAFSRFWFVLQTLHNVRDTQSGYRLYPLKRLYGLSILTSRYEAELEIPVFAAWHGVKLHSVPVRVFYPSREERVSHFRPLPDFMRIFVLNCVLCVLAVVYGIPRMMLTFLWKVVRTLYTVVLYLLGMLFYVIPVTLYIKLSGGDTEEGRDRMHRFIHSMVRFVLLRHGIPGVKYTCGNPGGEDFKTPAVMICNHQSHFDLLPLLALTDKMVVLTTDWVWNNPLYGFMIRYADFLPVSSGYDAIMPRLKELALRGYSIAVYPEGTRSKKDGGLGRFHQGAFHIAGTLNLDMIPLLLYGSGKVLPKHGRIINGWHMHLEIGGRISPEGMTEYGQTFRERSSEMRKRYKREYTSLADRIERGLF